MADEYAMFIDGSWTASESGAVFEATSPSTGEVIGTVPQGTREDVYRAIDGANRAWPGWAAMSAFDRSAAMRRIGAAIEARRDDLARTPALAYGNAVVLAPAPTTSVCAAKLAECIGEADLPPGVFNLVTGPGPVVGDEVAANEGTHAVGFIGSVATGRRVAERAAGKELLLEMGGNGPLVVLEDADLDRAVEATLTACFLNAGQSCTAGERILVHTDVHADYLARLTAAIAERIRLGDPFDDVTTMGPLNNPGVADKTERHVNDALERGAWAVVGGKRAPQHGSDLFFEATVLDGVTEEMEIAREETFGPVVPISAIGSEDEAIALVNGSPYGLLSAVFTRDLGRGLRFAEAVRTGWV